MLQKRWSDYTEKEINKVKREKCVKCKYCSLRDAENRDLEKIAIGNVTCDYLLKTGKRREVRPRYCKHYKEK